MMTLEEYVHNINTVKIIIVDDEKSSNSLLKKKLCRSLEGVKVIERDMPEHLHFDLAHEKPLVVVVDWYYKGYECSVILERLEMYKGLICIFTNEQIDIIKNKVKQCLGKVPENFRIINKFNFKGLENEIIDYCSDHL